MSNDEASEDGSYADGQDDDEPDDALVADDDDDAADDAAEADDDDDDLPVSQNSKWKEAAEPAPKRARPAAEPRDDDDDDDGPTPKSKRKSSASAAAGASPTAAAPGGSPGAAAASKSAPAAASQGKAKKAAAGGGDVRTQIERFVVGGNRPYGVQHVIEGIPGTDKGVAESMLTSLERSGQLTGKAVTKGAKLFWANQAFLKKVSSNDIQQAKFDADTTLQEARQIEAEASALLRKVAARENEPNNSELDAAISRAVSELDSVKVLFSKRRGVKGVTKPQMTKVCKAHNDFRTLWLKRKRAFKDVIDMLADNMDKKPKDLQKEIADKQDVETDEDVRAGEAPPPVAVPAKDK